MLNKRHYIILGLVVLLTVVLLSLPGRVEDRLKLAIKGLFLPLSGLAAWTHGATAGTGETLTSKRELLRVNAELRASNQVLNFQLRQASNALAENERLRRMLNFRRSRPTWNLLPARVVARDPELWWRSVWIDAGSRTPGMRTNLAVLTPEGALAGKVVSMGESQSCVLLLGDPGLRVAVLTGTNRLSGTLTAGSSGTPGNNLLDLENLFGETADRTVRPGDEVETWGAGGVFPPNIPVGRVVDVPRKDYGAATQARVRLSGNLDALENVWVVILP
jgi:rod shape-determining protein MreC